jgi:uncharacterized Tic20 family protein
MTPPPAGGDSSKDDRTLAMIAHLGGILVSFIAPLIVWLMKKDQPGFVEDQAKEALNFQITALIAFVALSILSMVPFAVCLSGPAALLLYIAVVVLSIMAGVKANDGVRYRYPVTLRLIK